MNSPENFYRKKVALPPFLAAVRSRVGQNSAGVAGSQRRQHDNDLQPRAESWRARGDEFGGSNGGGFACRLSFYVHVYWLGPK